MPMYTYRCEENGHEFSVRQRMSDDPLTDCQVCSLPVRKVINSVGIVFKGSGFYVTDNRNGKSGRANGGATADSSDAAGSEGNGNGSDRDAGDDGKKSEKPAAESPKTSQTPITAAPASP